MFYYVENVVYKREVAYFFKGTVAINVVKKRESFESSGWQIECFES